MSPQEPKIPKSNRLDSLILGRIINTHRKKMIQSNLSQTKRIDLHKLKDKKLARHRSQFKKDRKRAQESSQEQAQNLTL